MTGRFLFRLIKKNWLHMGINTDISGLPSECACTRLKFGFAAWKNTLIFCFNTQIIYAWHYPQSKSESFQIELRQANWSYYFQNTSLTSLNFVVCQDFICQK